MFAIASLFKPAANHSTQKLWDTLEKNCGLSGIRTSPYPHFSWLSAEELKWNAIQTRLRRICASTQSFKVRTAGLGIFTGPRPILYLPLVKTLELMRLHERIWKAELKYLVQPNAYYAPGSWIPHITIAYGDLTLENLPCAITDILNNPLELDILVDNVSVIYRQDEEAGVREVFRLGG
jgi:2'-5' RNA ligase